MVEGVRPRGIAGAPLAIQGSARGSISGGGFSIDDGIEPGGQKARLSSVAALGLDSMLALQTVDESGERDRGARKRGMAMVASLTRLQRIILLGGDASAALRELADLTAGGATASDPGLEAILRAIILRSRIEIARRGHRE